MFPTAVLLDTLRSKKIGYLGLDVYRPARVEIFCHEGIENHICQQGLTLTTLDLPLIKRF
jgi:lactate dehydrogenase-like 2-hydroxyacid dehydrogenase